MKKFIIAVAMFVSATANAANVRFQHWSVVDDTHIQATAEINDRTVSLAVFKKDERMSLLVHAEDMSDSEGDPVVLSDEMTVNNQPIKVTVSVWSNGSMLIQPKTVRGNNFVNGELWAKSKIYFKFSNQHFWFSGKGVQKAWNYLHSVKGVAI